MSGEAWDLVVVGAGPAGAAAALGALRADPGLRVLLLDRADFPRDKSCGDGIAPHVLDVLAGVGAGDVVRRLGAAAPARARPRRARRRRPMARPVWVIPRAVFDARLVERAVAAGAVLRRHRVSHAAPRGRRRRDRRLAPTRRRRRRRRRPLGGPRLRSAPRGAAARARDPRLRADPAARRGRQVIRYGDRRQPSYAWAFDRGDGLSNVGYGELLGRGTGDGPPSRALLLDQLERLLPGAGADGDRLARPPPAAVGLALAPARRAGAAGRRRRRPGQPDDRRGHLLRGRHRDARRPGGGRAPCAAGTPAAAGAAHRPRVRRLLGRHLRHTWVASRLSRRPAGRRRRHPGRRPQPAGLRRPGRDRPRRRPDHPAAGVGLAAGARRRPRSATSPTPRTPVD